MKKIYFAGGCFWGVEKYFALIKGVKKTSVGYANGNSSNPDYKQVCKGDANFAETVKVIYDEKEINLKKLIDYYLMIIDPTSINKQGNDKGVQYRTGIYYTDVEDEVVIERKLKDLSEKIGKPVVIENKKLMNYYLAEDYHQKYLDKNIDGYCHIPAVMFKKASESN